MFLARSFYIILLSICCAAYIHAGPVFSKSHKSSTGFIPVCFDNNNQPIAFETKNIKEVGSRLDINYTLLARDKKTVIFYFTVITSQPGSSTKHYGVRFPKQKTVISEEHIKCYTEWIRAKEQEYPEEFGIKPLQEKKIEEHFGPESDFSKTLEKFFQEKPEQEPADWPIITDLPIGETGILEDNLRELETDLRALELNLKK